MIKENSTLTSLLFIAVVGVLFLGIGLELACLGGVFTGHYILPAHAKHVANQASRFRQAEGLQHP